MNKELEYTLKHSRRSVEAELQNVVDSVKELQAKIASGDWSNMTDWTGGYVARDVAKVTALLAQQQALTNALYIVGKKQ